MTISAIDPRLLMEYHRPGLKILLPQHQSEDEGL
jgi:hypothetical protein